MFSFVQLSCMGNKTVLFFLFACPIFILSYHLPLHFLITSSLRRRSPSGNRLAFAAHDSTLHILECPNEQSHQQVAIRYPLLPFVDILFLNENSLVGVGHDYNPVLFQASPQGWAYKGKLDVKVAGGAKKVGVSAAAMFQNMDKKGQADGATETTIDTKHQNCITNIQPFGGPLNKLAAFSTSGLDGIIAVWDVATIERTAGVKIN